MDLYQENPGIFSTNAWVSDPMNAAAIETENNALSPCGSNKLCDYCQPRVN
jgi:hypothetical protein